MRDSSALLTHRGWKGWLCKLLLVTMVFFLGWMLVRAPRVQVMDVGKAQTIVLPAPKSGRIGWDVYLRVHGQIDGSAVIVMAGDGQKTELKGEFDMDLGRRDCYGPSYTLKYFPATEGTKGKVIVSCRFYEIGSWSGMLREKMER